jgi:hypothetical protein
VLKKLIAIPARKPSRNKVDALFGFLDGLDDLVEVRPFARIEFGMEQFAIGANFEGAAARRN